MSIPKSLRNFLVVIRDHTVIAYSANHKSFYIELKKIEELKEVLPSESTVKRGLNEKGILIYLGNDKKIYALQKVV